MLEIPVCCSNEIKIARVFRKFDDVILPQQASSDDVGYDIRAYKDTYVQSGALCYIETGLIVEPPSGFHFELALRSSAPRRHGIIMPHGIGIIDPRYCGPADELKILVFKITPGSEDIGGRTKILAGEKIAQLILRRTNHFEWEEREEIQEQSRGGFGSTGK